MVGPQLMSMSAWERAFGSIEDTIFHCYASHGQKNLCLFLCPSIKVSKVWSS